MANTVCHVEFVADDIQAGSEFMSKLFGWKTFPSGDKYMVWSAGEGETGGGVMTREDWQQGQRCVVYIHVEDVEKSLADVEANGGKVIHSKTKISDDHGFYALFSTPDGTVVGLWNKT